jgi:hypothetical protein
MTETNSQTFLTAIPDDKKIHSIVINDEDDIDIDVKSSADSDEDTPIVNHEIQEIFNKKDSQKFSTITIANQSNEVLQDKL